MGSSAALFLLFSSLRVNGCFENGNQRAAWLAKLVLCGNHVAIQSITLQNLFTSLITKVELQGWKDNQNLLSNVYDFNKTPQKDLSWFFCLVNLIIFSNDLVMIMNFKLVLASSLLQFMLLQIWLICIKPFWWNMFIS